MRALLTAAIAGVGLLVAACGAAQGSELEYIESARTSEERRPAERGASTAFAEESAASANLDARCENPEDGYRIRFPGSWHTNDGQVTAACQVFDLEVPELAPNTVMPLASSVLILVVDRGFEEMLELIDHDPATDVHHVEELQIGERAALRVDGVATGEAYLPEDLDVHRTYVAFGERTLVASSNGLGEPELLVRRELIADMLATLEPLTAQEGDVGT